MHKRNLILTALVLSTMITVVFLVFPRIHHGIIGWLYLPSIALSVTIAHFFGGNGHSPSELVGWSSFAVYTVFDLVLALVIYVISLEIYLVRQALHHLDDAKNQLAPEKVDAKAALEKIGQAIVEVETRRRTHFLLQSNNSIDLNEPHHLLAARAIAGDKQPKLVKKLLAKLKSRLATSTGALQAHAKLLDLQKDAETFVSKITAS